MRRMAPPCENSAMGISTREPICISSKGPPLYATWDAATLGSGGDATTGLTSSPSGTSHSFVWASGTDLGNVLNSKVEFRITPSSSSGTGSNATSGTSTVNNSRPRLT